MHSNQLQKTSLTSSFYSVPKYSKINNLKQSKHFTTSKPKSISLPKQKKASSIISKTTKFPQKSLSNIHSPQNTSAQNNTIDINISVNYHKNANLLKNSKHAHTGSLYKAPFRKITSYSMNQTAHKRNGNDCSDPNIIHNNLNISLTNISSPKESNSFVVNPIFHGCNHIHQNIHKSLNIKNNSSSASNIVHTGNNKSISGNSFNIGGKDYNKAINKLAKRNKTKIETLKKIMNDKIKECSKRELDLDTKNDKKFQILQNCLDQFMNYIQNIKEAEFLISFNNHLKDIMHYKNEKIEDLINTNVCLAEKFHELAKVQFKHELPMSFKEESHYNIEIENEDEINSDNIRVEESSSVREVDLESIRFFDKIQMRTKSISHTKVPKLNLDFSNNNNTFINNNNKIISNIEQKNNNKSNYYYHKKNLKAFQPTKGGDNGRNINYNNYISSTNIQSQKLSHQVYGYSTKAEYKQKKNKMIKKINK
jgi:hypothetical protein